MPQLTAEMLTQLRANPNHPRNRTPSTNEDTMSQDQPSAATAVPAMPIAAVEMQEYLFSASLAKIAVNVASDKSRTEVEISDHITAQARASLRFHRFQVMNWLLMNGVQIPATLLSDDAHPRVGQQWADQKAGHLPTDSA